MSCPRKNIFTGKTFRKRQPKWKRQADYRRRKRGSYKVSRETRRKISIGLRRRRRDIFSSNPGRKPLSITGKIIRWFIKS